MKTIYLIFRKASPWTSGQVINHYDFGFNHHFFYDQYLRQGGMSHYKEIVKHFLEISNTFLKLLIGMIKIIFDYEDLYHVHVSPVFGSQH